MQQGLEKYLMTKIYYKTFAQSELDRERDVALTQRMAALNFVQPHHLDIPKHYQENNASQLAVKELHKINNYKVCLGLANLPCSMIYLSTIHLKDWLRCRHQETNWSVSSIAVGSSTICCMLLEMTIMKLEVKLRFTVCIMLLSCATMLQCCAHKAVLPCSVRPSQPRTSAEHVTCQNITIQSFLAKPEQHAFCSLMYGALHIGVQTCCNPP